MIYSAMMEDDSIHIMGVCGKAIVRQDKGIGHFQNLSPYFMKGGGKIL
jgi:hypothetical protein